MTDHIIPLVIRNEAGTVVDVAACNQKSRNKSLEQGELWVALQENGRVLPYQGGGVACGPISLAPGDNAQFALVTCSATATVTTSATTTSTSATTPAPPAPPASPASPASAERIAVFSDLADLIAQRHRDMPEGSYTTHLFTRGGDKIRKKTGEEAIEVILAQTAPELTSEAADLLYHLMVLLEWEGVRIEAVVEELRRR